jgi:hypothetical protein
MIMHFMNKTIITTLPGSSSGPDRVAGTPATATSETCAALSGQYSIRRHDARRKRCILTALFAVTATLVLYLLSSPVARAASPDTFDRDGADDSAPWQSYSQTMSPEEYRDAYHDNRRMLKDYALSYAKRTAASWGTPKAVMQGVGFAAAAALQNEGSLSLGDSEILEIEFQDALDTDRALLLKARFRW